MVQIQHPMSTMKPEETMKRIPPLTTQFTSATGRAMQARRNLRPAGLTAAQERFLLARAAGDLEDATAARTACVSPETVRDWKRRDPVFLQRYHALFQEWREHGRRRADALMDAPGTRSRPSCSRRLRPTGVGRWSRS